MQMWRRLLFCQLCSTSVSAQTRRHCTSTLEENVERTLATVSNRKRRRNRLLRRPDESIFAKCGFPQFDNMAKEEFETRITDSKVYNRGGIVALNKPAGIPVTGSSRDPVNILEVIPGVMESIGKPAAEIATAADKESSGLILLGENKGLLETSSIHYSKQGGEISWLENIGTIDIPIGPQKIGDQTLMVPIKNPSKGGFERKEALRCKTDYRVLSANLHLHCSLLELNPLKLQKHQLQVHLSNKLCYILGDQMYSNRIQGILGVPVLVDPLRATTETRILPNPIQKVLNLRTWHLSRLPLFLHWYQVTLPEWHKGKDVTITAPPPEYFMEALRRLDLHSDIVKDIT